MTALFLALVFLAELAAWSAIGTAAYGLAGGGISGWIAAAVAVAAAVGAWGLWASPKSSAPGWLTLGTKVVVLGGAVIGVFVVGRPWWAAALAALIVVAHAGVRLSGDRP